MKSMQQKVKDLGERSDIPGVHMEYESMQHVLD